VLLYVSASAARTWPLERSRRAIKVRVPTVPAEVSAARTWPRLTVFGRMLWLSWRESRGQAIAMLAIYAIVMFWLTVMFPTDNSHWRFLLAAQLAIGSAFLGAATLQGNQSFLAQGGASPRLFWLSRQIVWLLVALAGATPLMVH